MLNLDYEDVREIYETKNIIIITGSIDGFEYFGPYFYEEAKEKLDKLLSTRYKYHTPGMFIAHLMQLKEIK